MSERGYYEQKKLSRAQRVWEKAIRHYPEGTEARLQLAALMAVRFEYANATEQVREVLKREPSNPEALRLQKMLNDLETQR